MTTLATATGLTVTLTETDLPSQLAAISAVPAPVPVTVPLAATVATAGFRELQVTGLFIGLPVVSLTVAFSSLL